MRNSLLWFAFALPLFMTVGCGEDPGPPRDPTLRGTLARMKEAGFAFVTRRAPASPREDQKARLGRAAGLANELVGAGIRTDFPTDTKWGILENHPIRLERYASSEKAAEMAADRQRVERSRTDAGRVVTLQAGDKVVVLEGLGMQSGSVPGQRARPKNPPDATLVAELRAFLEEDEAE